VPALRCHTFRTAPRALLFALAVAAGNFVPSRSSAWIFPEHAAVTREGLRVVRLDGTRAATLDDVWAAARTGFGTTRVCVPADAAATSTACIPLAALPALAGDHSCSPADLLSVLATQHWTLDVLATAADAAADLRNASPTSRVAIRHGLNIDLQKSDALYASRAHVNGAHFQLTREAPAPYGDPNLATYLAQSLRPKQEPNATALYANFHAAAIRWARKAAPGGQGCGFQPQAAAQALLEEAFALHFLEDSFAAGHVVGSWGGTSYRIGTHDFYCGFGIDAHTWNGHYYAAYGDAFLTPTDLAMTGAAVGESIGEVLDVLHGDDSENAKVLVSAYSDEALNVCTTAEVPSGLDALSSSVWIAHSVAFEPIPPSRNPSVPRGRGEFGLFLGGSASAAQSADLSVPVTSGFFAKASAAMRVGYGFDAVTAPRMSNQAFFEAGVVGEQNPHGQEVGLAARLQVPWAYLPLDGLVALPVAAARQDSEFWVGWAERAGRGPFGIQRTFLWSENFSGQVSALTDFSISAFPSQRRYEISAPMLSFYGALPLEWLVTTDGLVDIGIEEIIDPLFSSPHTAAFVSLSSATRVFP
jgi:hypothetical protein